MSVGPLSGHFISGGIEAKDLIEAGATVAYTDEDGDGLFDQRDIVAALQRGDYQSSMFAARAQATLQDAATHQTNGSKTHADQQLEALDRAFSQMVLRRI